MGEFFSKIDPATVVALVSGVLAWFGIGKYADRKNASLENLVRQAVRNKWDEIVADPKTWQHARELLGDAAWSALRLAKIKKTPITEALVRTLVDELAGRLETELLRQSVADLVRRAGELPKVFTELPSKTYLDPAMFEATKISE